jgi:hypothetical protein
MNLGQLLEKILPIQLEGKATGGTVGTIVDSTLPGTYDDDSFKGSLAFVHSTTDGLAPQNEFAAISAFVDSTGTFTVDANLGAVVGAGDYYSIADPQYKKAPVLRIVNDTLRAFGIISLVDTSLTTSYNTSEYALPLALKAFPIDKIEVGSATYGWDTLNGWYVVPAAAGSQATIVFETLPPYDRTTPSNNTLRIWYRDYHPALTIYSDKVSETIPDKRVIDECKLALQEWIMEKNSDLSPEALQRLGILQRKQAESEVKQRINLPNRKISRFLSIRDTDCY